MSATRPPEDNHWTVEYISSNGAATTPRSERAHRLVVLGYITAVALPLIGLVLGIFIATRPTKAISKHGFWIIVVSILALIAWVLVFTSGLLTETNSDLAY